VETPIIDAEKSEINLFLDSVLELMDIDFHQVTGTIWDKIKVLHGTPNYTKTKSVYDDLLIQPTQASLTFSTKSVYSVNEVTKRSEVNPLYLITHVTHCRLG